MDFIPSVFRNGVATNPDTHSARENHAAILKASQEAGYSTVGRATGHDKSWVSRWLNGQGLVSLPELLAWLDHCELRVVHESDLSTGANGEMVERLEAVLEKLTGLESAMAAMGEGGALHALLASLAIEALKARIEKAAAQ